MSDRRGIGFDVILAAVGTVPIAGGAIWHWPWDDGWLGWLGWPLMIVFAACFALARVIAGLYSDWPKGDAPEVNTPQESRQELNRPITLMEVTALGLGAAALFGFAWVITHPKAFRLLS